MEPMKERHNHILGEVVRAYLDHGLPVGSRTLAENSSLALSPASIRNVLADLEKRGMLCSPHTSAGRMPTDEGLRYFVDSLMTMDESLQGKLESAVSEHLQHRHDPQLLLRQAMEELSQLTNFAGLISVHERGFTRIARIELIPVSSEQILAVVISTKGEVQNRLIRREPAMSDERLKDIARQLSELLCDCPLEDMRERLASELRRDRLKINSLLEDLNQTLASPIKADTKLLVSGQRKLLDSPEFGVIETVRSLFAAFEEKEELLRLIEQVESSESGVKVFIGHEHALVHLEEVSVVLARYEDDNRVIGTLGVIGPKRMQYEKVVPVVDCTARWVSRMLGGKA